MKKIIVLMILLSMSKNASSQVDFEYYGLREHQNLIIEISEVKVAPCPECHIQLDRYSYKIAVKDAFLRLNVAQTARGEVYTPYLKSFVKSVSGHSSWDSPVKIPAAGLYVGTLWKVCNPWDMAADGSCKGWDIQYNLVGSVKTIP
jgi:hypothetical protein